MPGSARTCVMVVDDAALVRLYYRGVLEPAGFAVEEAVNGLEALEKLLAVRVDLLIVDINMPRMDGLTFVAALRRADASIAATPVLMISSEADPQDMAAARTAGANFYLIKPVAAEAVAQYAGLLCGVAE